MNVKHTDTAEKHGEVHHPNGPPPALVRGFITENENDRMRMGMNILKATQQLKSGRLLHHFWHSDM